MPPRPRIRGREPPPPQPPGGRYRRRSPRPPSPRHYRRDRDPPPPPRRSPERPRRPEEKHFASCGGERPSRADILLEAGRLAAEYLVARGLLPEDVLPGRGKEVSLPNHSSRTERPAPESYRRKRDDSYHDDDPRWRRNGSGGDWRREEEEERLPRRSGWDRRSLSYDERHKCNDGGVDRDSRRSHEYDEPRRVTMPRTSSYNDRRPYGDGGMDRRRRSRSRSKSRSRSYYYGDRTDLGWRTSGGDFDHRELPEPGIMRGAGGDGYVDYDDVNALGLESKRPRSVVVMEVNNGASQSAATEVTKMESEIMEVLDRAQYISGAKVGENAVSGLSDADVGGMDILEQDLPSVPSVDVHLTESAEEPEETQFELGEVVGDMDVGIAHGDACLIEPVAGKNDCSQVMDVMMAPQSEAETGDGDLSGDEQQPPASFRIFDLNLVGTHENCEMSEISGDPPVDHLCDSVADLIGGMDRQGNCDSSATQAQDEHAEDNHQFENEQMFLNQGMNVHDLDNYDLNNDQMFLNQGADEHAQDNHQFENEHMLIKQHMGAQDLDNYSLNNEQMNQGVNELTVDSHQLENDHMLLNQGTSVHNLDDYNLNNDKMFLHRCTDGYAADSRQLEVEQMLLNQGTGGHDLDDYHLNNKLMLLSQVTDGRPADNQNLAVRQMIPMINLEDDYEEQSDTKEFLESKSEISHKNADNVPEQMHSQDQQTLSFPDHLQTNIPAASSPIKPTSGNRWTGRDVINAQGIPGDDDVLYVAFEKIPLEVINVWDLPSSELGKSL